MFMEGHVWGKGYAQVWKRKRVIVVSLVGHVSGSNMLAHCSSIKSKGSTIEGMAARGPCLVMLCMCGMVLFSV